MGCDTGTPCPVEWAIVFDILFRFLFKYPPLLFQQGDFSWGVSRPVLLAIAGRVAALAVARAADLSGRSAGEQPLRDGMVLVGLRLAALALLLFCLFRPTLILKAAVPQQNFVGVLIDDSRSMTIADTDGQPRSAFVQEQLSRPERAAASGAVADDSSCGSSASLPRPTGGAAGDLKYGGTATRLGAGARARARRAGRAAARRAW